MTETVSALVNWAKKESKIKSIYAETSKENNASIVVLEKNNFKKYGENENYFCWKLAFD